MGLCCEPRAGGLKNFVRRAMKSQQGFTLIESLVYIGLFAIIMTGVFVALFSITQGSQRIGTKVMLQQEGSFMLSKIDWALTGLQNINPIDQPVLGAASSNLLQVNKTDLSITDLVIKQESAEMKIARNGVDFIPLDNSNVDVSNLQFIHLGTAVGPEWVKASFTLTTKTYDGQTISQNFETTKYVRK